MKIELVIYISYADIQPNNIAKQRFNYWKVWWAEDCKSLAGFVCCCTAVIAAAAPTLGVTYGSVERIS